MKDDQSLLRTSPNAVVHMVLIALIGTALIGTGYSTFTSKESVEARATLQARRLDKVADTLGKLTNTIAATRLAGTAIDLEWDDPPCDRDTVGALTEARTRRDPALFEAILQAKCRFIGSVARLDASTFGVEVLPLGFDLNICRDLQMIYSRTGAEAFSRSEKTASEPRIGVYRLLESWFQDRPVNSLRTSEFKSFKAHMEVFDWATCQQQIGSDGYSVRLKVREPNFTSYIENIMLEAFNTR